MPLKPLHLPLHSDCSIACSRHREYSSCFRCWEWCKVHWDPLHLLNKFCTTQLWAQTCEARPHFSFSFPSQLHLAMKSQTTVSKEVEITASLQNLTQTVKSHPTRKGRLLLNIHRWCTGQKCKQDWQKSLLERTELSNPLPDAAVLLQAPWIQSPVQTILFTAALSYTPYDRYK